MEFPHLITNLDAWATFVVDSPIGNLLRGRLNKDLAKAHKFSSAATADLICFGSAIYQGGHDAGYKEGHDAGRIAGARDWAASQPKPPQTIRVHGAWETVDEYSRHGAQIGWFSTDVDAKIAADKRGWYGGEGSVISYDAIRYDGVVYVLRDKIADVDMDKDLPKLREEKITAAKLKLTPEELSLLGLKP